MVQASWQTFDPSWPHTLIVVDVVNPQVVWAAGGGFPNAPAPVPGTVVRTVDGGQTWRNFVIPPDGPAQVYRDVEASDPNHAVVLAPETPAGHSRIFRTADGGGNWVTAFDANATDYYDSMAFFDHRRGLAVSDPVGGTFPILATDDGGATWALVQVNATPNAEVGEFGLATGTCLVAVGPRDAWFGTAFDVNVALNANARVFRTQDGGTNWTVATTPIPARITSLSFRDRTNGLAVGGNRLTDVGVAARTSNGGNTWFPGGALPGFRHSVAWIPGRPNTAIVVGPTGSDVTDDGGATWTPVDPPAPFLMGVACQSQNACWAVGATAGQGSITPGERGIVAKLSITF
jgi:photosystem II stability/assembly factor-like uncharacterized protein